MLARLLGNPWVLGGLGAVFAGLFIVVLYYRGEAISAEAERDAIKIERDAAHREIARQNDYIAKVDKLRDTTDAIIAKLFNEIADINKQAEETSESIRDLEKTDEEVRQLLERALPDALKRLLNRP